MSWLHGLRERLRGALRADVRERELGEEIRHHLELETARQIERGLSTDAARLAALDRFGSPTWVHEAARDERGANAMEGSMRDVQWSLRSLRRHAGFTTLALITLALGIGATTVAFTVLDTVLLRPLRYRQPDRLVTIRELTADHTMRWPSHPNFLDWRDRTRSFSGVASEMFPFNVNVVVGSEPVRVPYMGVSRGFFEVLGVASIVGRTFTADETKLGGAAVVMVSYDFWKTHMGGRMPLGTIHIGSSPEMVIGVLPRDFRFVDFAELFFPHEHGPGTIRSAHNYRVIARLAPGVSIAAARSEMTALSRTMEAEYGTETQAADADVTSLREFLVGDYRVMLAIVFGSSSLVLLIACTNLVSAQLARGLQRAHEVAVRSALGASRGRLVRQLVVESSVLALGGAALGTAFTIIVTRVVRLLGAGLVPRLDELAVDGRVLLFAALVTMATALLIGLYPAFRVTAADPGRRLGNAARGGATTTRTAVWRVLVAFEVATAVVLLVGSALLVRTLRNILTSDMGIDPRGVVTVGLTPGEIAVSQIEQMRTELAALPGVSGAAFTSQLPLNWGNYSAPLIRPTDPEDRDWPILAGFRVITPDYFHVLRQSVVRGRAFTESDRAGSPAVAIITPGIAQKLWPGEDPIGKRVRTLYLKDWLTVVGVVSEATNWMETRGSQHELFTPLAQQPKEGRFQLVALLRTSGDPQSLTPSVRARMRTLAPGSPVRLGTLEARVAKSAADRSFAMFALVVFGAIALLLAGIGIYGVISYSVITRTHEIGVRMALGATPGLIRRSVLREATATALGGIATGLIAASFATRYLQSVLFGVTQLDPAAYVAGAIVLMLTALMSAYVPAWRSSRVDPMLAIRGD